MKNGVNSRSRRAYNACKASKIEERTVESIDQVKAWADSLTLDEMDAFEIAWGWKKPEGKHTREWAEKKIRAVTRPKFVARMAARAFCKETPIGEMLEIVKFFVPAAPQKVEVDSTNRNINCNYTAEDLKDPIKLQAAYLAEFGVVPIVED